MPRILVIEGSDRARALLQCRLAADVKIKFAPCMEAAWEKFRGRKYDLIVWNAASDPAGEINLGHTLRVLAAKTLGVRTIVFTTAENADASRPCGDNVHLKKYPISDDELLSLIEN